MKLIDIRIAWRVHGGWPGRSELMVDLGSSKSITRLASVALLLICAGCQSVETSTDGRSWGEPVLVQTITTTTALRPQVAIGPMGEEVVIWDQTDPDPAFPPAPGQNPEDSDDVWWSFCCDADGAWAEQERLDSRDDNEPYDSLFPQVGIDADGIAVIAFLQSDGTRLRVWALRDDLFGDFREEPICIQSTADDRDCSRLESVGDVGPPPQLAVDAKGNAVVVWQQGGTEDESTSVWLNRSAVGYGWGNAEELEPSVRYDLLKPAVAMDPDGSAILVWERLDRDPNRSSIWTVRQTRDGVLEEAQQLENTSGNAFQPRVATDAQGNAIAVWIQQEARDAPFRVQAHRYVAEADRWEGDAETIGTQAPEDEQTPQIAMDADGNAVAVWTVTSGATSDIWSNRYIPNVGWEVPVRIGLRREVGPAGAPQVDVNAVGEAVAVWVQFDGVQDRIWSNRLTPGGGWAVSEPISSVLEDGFDRAGAPQVAVGSDGSAAAVWVEGRTTVFRLWASRLGAEPTQSGMQ